MKIIVARLLSRGFSEDVSYNGKGSRVRVRLAADDSWCGCDGRLIDLRYLDARTKRPAMAKESLLVEQAQAASNKGLLGGQSSKLLDSGTFSRGVRCTWYVSWEWRGYAAGFWGGFVVVQGLGSLESVGTSVGIGPIRRWSTLGLEDLV
jgi:hypothetical protein